MDDHTGHDGARHAGNRGDDHAHSHLHDMRNLARHRLWVALWINLVFLAVEVAGGLLSNSLALLADAGHMLTDVAALVLALVVARLAERPATPRRTYGLMRAEVLGALVNGASLVIIVGFILFEAWRRLEHPNPVDGPVMLVVAVLGLVANAVSAWVLHGSRNVTVNMKGAFLHMMADALGSVGAVTAGTVIMLTGWTPVDTIASFVIGLLILWGSWRLISETINILLEATPEDIDYHEVRDALGAIPHVSDVHDLHIWTIVSGMPSLSAHLRLTRECSDTDHWGQCLEEAQTMLDERFGIRHVTLQFEPWDFDGSSIVCD